MMAKVDTSDLGPGPTGDQEGVAPERNGVDEERKIIEGAGDSAANGQKRDNELNLGQ